MHIILGIWAALVVIRIAWWMQRRAAARQFEAQLAAQKEMEDRILRDGADEHEVVGMMPPRLQEAYWELQFYRRCREAGDC
jgi:type II secretory pathway pseudopilin PulG